MITTVMDKPPPEPGFAESVGPVDADIVVELPVEVTVVVFVDELDDVGLVLEVRVVDAPESVFVAESVTVAVLGVFVVLELFAVLSVDVVELDSDSPPLPPLEPDVEVLSEPVMLKYRDARDIEFSDPCSLLSPE